MSKKKKRKGKILKTCTHEFAYCYFDKKSKCNVYQCVQCGKFSYQ